MTETTSKPAQGWRPFPIERLPSVLRALSTEGANANVTDPACIALPALACCTGAIGLSRSVRIKRGWSEPAVLWVVLIQPSGTVKSPSLDLAAKPLRDLDERARRKHSREFAAWKTAGAEGDPPGCERVVASDVTVEALAQRVLIPAAKTRRGAAVTIIRDELSGWFASRGEYKQSGNSDCARWLELYGGRSLSIDRVTAGSLYVPRSAVSVVGTTQPGTYRRAVSAADVEAGHAARILPAMPPAHPRDWSDAEVSTATLDSYSRAVEALHALQPTGRPLPEGDGEEAVPLEMALDDGARRVYARFVRRLGRWAHGRPPAIAAAAAKVEGATARLALVLALVLAAESGAQAAASLRSVSERAMRSAVRIGCWFMREVERVYGVLDIRGDADRAGDSDATRELVGHVGAHPGSTPSDVAQRGPRRYRGRPKEAARDLDALSGEGRPLIREPGPRTVRYYAREGWREWLGMSSGSDGAANGGSHAKPPEPDPEAHPFGADEYHPFGPPPPPKEGGASWRPL